MSGIVEGVALCRSGVWTAVCVSLCGTWVTWQLPMEARVGIQDQSGVNVVPQL